MRKLLRIAFWLLLIIVVGAGLFRAQQSLLARRRKALEEEPEPAGPPLVMVVEVQRGTLEQTIPVTCTVEPDSSALVYPETSGVLEELALPDGRPLEEGMEVEKGMVIAVVEHAELQAALREAEVNLRVTQFSLQEAEVALGDAKRESDRMSALYEKGVATGQQRDRARTAYERARAGVRLAQERVELAKATLEKVRLRREDATVKAPISGVISEKHVDRGSYVSPQTPLVKIVNIDHVEVRGGVAEKYSRLIRPGETRARVKVDACPDETFFATVERLQPEFHPVTRTAQVTLRLPNPEHRLKGGMFARVQIVVARKEGVPIVPDVALLPSSEGHRAFVVKEGKVTVRSVRIGLEEGPRNEVIEGLSVGELVVVRGHHLLEEGMDVRVQRQEGAE